MRMRMWMTAAAMGLLMTAALPMGAMAQEKGWVTEEGVSRFVDENGSYVKNDWKTKDGFSYYLDSQGRTAEDTWVDDTYYVDSDGRMLKNTWRYEDGSGREEKGWYYLGRDGKAEKNDWKNIENGRYCFDGQGRMRTGWHYENGEIYYLGGEEEGYIQSGWKYLESDGKKRAKEGTVSKALAENEDGGRWYYFQANGKAKHGENSIDEKKYYFDENGVMLTGWHCLKDKAAAGDSTGISRFGFLGGKDEGLLKGQWLDTKERPWATDEWSKAQAGRTDRQKTTVAETARTKRTDLVRRFYLQNDGTPAFLSADAATIKDAVTKVKGSYYFFDSYGCLQTGLLCVSSGGQTQTAYFGAEDSDGKMYTGRMTGVKDKAGKENTFYFESAGSLKGVGVTGAKDGFLYQDGMLVCSEAGTDYQVFLLGGKLYLVNEAGRIQTEEKAYKSDGTYRYLIEDEAIYTTDKEGNKKDKVKDGAALPQAAWNHIYQR